MSTLIAAVLAVAVLACSPASSERLRVAEDDAAWPYVTSAGLSADVPVFSDPFPSLHIPER